jgi:hypothetical protein
METNLYRIYYLGNVPGTVLISGLEAFEVPSSGHGTTFWSPLLVLIATIRDGQNASDVVRWRYQSRRNQNGTQLTTAQRSCSSCFTVITFEHSGAKTQNNSGVRPWPLRYIVPHVSS